MPTERSGQSFDFGAVEGRRVEAAFDAGLVTSDGSAAAGSDQSSDPNDGPVCVVLSRRAAS
jgi:hypothetical protein